jgi:hypothetical protein
VLLLAPLFHGSVRGTQCQHTLVAPGSNALLGFS